MIERRYYELNYLPGKPGYCRRSRGIARGLCLRYQVVEASFAQQWQHRPPQHTYQQIPSERTRFARIKK